MNEITGISRKLRKNQTAAEKKLWNHLRMNKTGVKFRRQYPILYTKNKKNKFFVADFACVKKSLIIEVDGEIHEKRKDIDEKRDSIIINLGFTILRFKNAEIFTNIDSVLEIIDLYLE